MWKEVETEDSSGKINDYSKLERVKGSIITKAGSEDQEMGIDMSRCRGQVVSCRLL
jgi:hypothetical protein